MKGPIAVVDYGLREMRLRAMRGEIPGADEIVLLAERLEDATESLEAMVMKEAYDELQAELGKAEDERREAEGERDQAEAALANAESRIDDLEQEIKDLRKALADAPKTPQEEPAEPPPPSPAPSPEGVPGLAQAGAAPLPRKRRRTLAGNAGKKVG